MLSRFIDAMLEKEKILEIYANVVEFGPNIFGVSQAAKEYFNKRAVDLDLQEMAFLTTLLPQPRRAIDAICKNRLPAAMNEKVRATILRLRSMNWISRTRAETELDGVIKFQPSKNLKQFCPTRLSRRHDPARMKL